MIYVALRHGVFCVSTQHRLVADYQGTLSCCIHEGLMCLFIVCETMFTVGEYHKQFPMQMTQNNKHNKSVEKIFHQNCSSSQKCQLKFIASGEDHHNKKLRSCEHSACSITNIYRGTCSDKILRLHCNWSQWREGTPTADASKSDEEIRQHLQLTVQLSSSIQQYAATTVTRTVQCMSRISFQQTEDSHSAYTPWATIHYKHSCVLSQT